MGAFEIIVTLLSFVYALALTQVLGSVNTMLLARDRVKFSLVQALWMAAAVLLLFNNWLSLIGLGGIDWTTALAAEAFLFAIVQYAACGLVAPRPGPGGRIDMEAHHRRHGVMFKTAFVILALMAMFNNVRHAGLYDRTAIQALLGQWPVIVLLTVSLIALWRRERGVQIACSGVLIALMLLVVFI